LLLLIIGISGANGVVCGMEILRVLKKMDQETHLIISDTGARNLGIVTSLFKRWGT
jgi:4-hydroxy-3-polyprenylbenzoate decarboxylase